MPSAPKKAYVHAGRLTRERRVTKGYDGLRTEVVSRWQLAVDAGEELRNALRKTRDSSLVVESVNRGELWRSSVTVKSEVDHHLSACVHRMMMLED
jgi:hypothetical protein